MKTICFELEDSVYEELSAMLTTPGLTEQVFYEFLTQPALKKHSLQCTARCACKSCQPVRGFHETGSLQKSGF